MKTLFSEVPASNVWPKKRARYLFSERRERAQENDEQLTASQSWGVISQKRYQELSGSRVTAALAGTENFLHVEKDDFVISLRTFEGGIERSFECGCISPAYTVMKPSREVHAGFFQYALKSAAFVSTLQTTVTGIRDGKSVRFHNFADLLLPIPDLASQEAIAEFLDRETARIDRLIEKKLRLLAVLAEKQASEVDSLVLGQRNPATQPSLDRGSRSVVKLKTLCHSLGNGFVGPTRDILEDKDASDIVPYLQSSHVKNRRIDFARRPYFVKRSWLATKPKARVDRGDLVIVQTGDCGATAIVSDEFAGAGCHAMIIVRVIKSKIHSELLLHILSSNYGRSQMAAIQTGALHPHLEVGFVKELPIPIPPYEEQEGLARRIELVVSKIEGLREKVHASIRGLDEYRVSLITHAVTGQLELGPWRSSRRTVTVKEDHREREAHS